MNLKVRQVSKSQVLTVNLIIVLIISLPVQVFAENKIETEIGNVSTSENIYYKEHTTSIIKIFGTIVEPTNNGKITIIITSPEGESTGNQVFPNKDGYYETYYSITSNSIIGEYTVSTSYQSNVIGDIYFELKSITDKPKPVVEEKHVVKETPVIEEKSIIENNIESIKKETTESKNKIYELTVKGKTGTLKTDKERYVKNNPGDLITINVGVEIDKTQKSALQENANSPDGIRVKFYKIFPQRIVIEDKVFAEKYPNLTSTEHIQLQLITKHDAYLSDFVTDTGDVISTGKYDGFGEGTLTTADASITLVDPLPGAYFIHADSKQVGVDHSPYKQRVKDTSCYSMTIRLNTPENQLPDCYEDPAKYVVPNPYDLIIYIDLDENYKLKPILSFVDQTKDPSYYVKRYIYDSNYKEWFEKNFPNYTIYEAIGMSHNTYVETKYELSVQDVKDKKASEIAVAEIKVKAEAEAKQENDRINFNNSVYGFVSSIWWIIVGIAAIVILLIMKKRRRKHETIHKTNIVQNALKQDVTAYSKSQIKSQQNSKFCGKCGENIIQNSKFCGKCGFKT